MNPKSKARSERRSTTKSGVSMGCRKTHPTDTSRSTWGHKWKRYVTNSTKIRD